MKHLDALSLLVQTLHGRLLNQRHLLHFVKRLNRADPIEGNTVLRRSVMRGKKPPFWRRIFGLVGIEKLGLVSLAIFARCLAHYFFCAFESTMSPRSTFNTALQIVFTNWSGALERILLRTSGSLHTARSFTARLMADGFPIIESSNTLHALRSPLFIYPSGVSSNSVSSSPSPLPWGAKISICSFLKILLLTRTASGVSGCRSNKRYP